MGEHSYSYIPQPITDYKFKDINPLSAGYDNVKANSSIGPRIREHYLIQYVLNGFGVYEKNDVCYNVGPGDFFVIPPYAKCTYTADSKNPWEYIWISFDCGIELPKIMENAVIHRPDVKPIFESIRNCSKNGKSLNAHIISCIWLFLSILFEDEQEKHGVDYVDIALSIIHTRYADNISVSSIARELNLDRRYLSSLFTKKVGKPMRNYIIIHRLIKAAELMTVNKASASVAANSVGIYDICYFSKIFKKHFGMSPRTYIKNRIGKKQ